MAVENIGTVVQFGLDYERARVEVAARNLAIANVAIPPGQSVFSQSVGVVSGQAGQTLAVDIADRKDAGLRKVHDPSHPLADADGMVSYPKIEPAMEMATLVSATRSYEAGVRAYNAIRAMTLKAFEIGKST